MFLFSCASKAALEDPPIITSATYQHTLYNGRGQAVEAAAARDDAPAFIITYFTSEEDLEQNRGGSAEPPAEVGDYYVCIERPAGNGYRQGKDVTVEYHIQKAFIVLDAEAVQRASYDGTPKTASAAASPAVELRFDYFAGGAPLAGPPAEKGAYRVRVFFDGNGRYMGASKDVTLIIE